MATYRQTTLIPLPKKQPAEMRYASRYGRGYRGEDCRNANNQDINSILSFFE